MRDLVEGRWDHLSLWRVGDDMAARRLTSAFCNAVQAVGRRQLSYPDAVVGGLELRVSGDGRKTWSFRYRTKLGRQCRITLGVHTSAFGLSEAREAARRLLGEVSGGGDPGLSLRRRRIEAATEHLKTFGDLAAAYFADTEGGRYRCKRASTIRNETIVYRKHIQSSLARIPLESMDRRLIRGMLKRLLDAGVTSQAVRAQAVIRQILNYGVFEERLAFNPIRDLPPVVTFVPRRRVYSDEELRLIWNGVKTAESLRVPPALAEKRRDGERVKIGAPMRLAILLSVQLLQRRCEILGMARSELDLRHGLWTIPATRMKSKRDHVVPLSPWVIENIEAALALSDELGCDLIFPGPRDSNKPICGHALNWAFGAVLKAVGIEGATPHDLRRTGSTLMTSERVGVAPFIRSKVLGHSDSGGGAQVSMRHYDVNEYVRAKRDALEKWQSLLRDIVGETPAPSATVQFAGLLANLGGVGSAPTSMFGVGPAGAWLTQRQALVPTRTVAPIVQLVVGRASSSSTAKRALDEDGPSPRPPVQVELFSRKDSVRA